MTKPATSPSIWAEWWTCAGPTVSRSPSRTCGDALGATATAAQHIELARRYKNGEAGSVLAREYGVSQCSLRQVISRVERAGKMLAQKRLRDGQPARESTETNAASGLAPAPSESETSVPNAAAEQAPDGQASPAPDGQSGASSGETSDTTGVSVWAVRPRGP